MSESFEINLIILNNDFLNIHTIIFLWLWQILQVLILSNKVNALLSIIYNFEYLALGYIEQLYLYNIYLKYLLKDLTLPSTFCHISVCMPKYSQNGTPNEKKWFTGQCNTIHFFC